MRQRARLARARARDDADIPLRRRDGLVLRAVQSRKQMLHALSPSPLQISQWRYYSTVLIVKQVFA